MKETSVKRYDIYLYNFGENKGSIQSGLRPVLVIQDDRMNANSPTTIVAVLQLQQRNCISRLTCSWVKNTVLSSLPWL